ncbi:MAG: mechanosensitive ion channel [Phycisphaerales bacterium]|nr:mechanosensitive ion channel [Phycisphaerales bacterium]
MGFAQDTDTAAGATPPAEGTTDFVAVAKDGFAGLTDGDVSSEDLMFLCTRVGLPILKALVLIVVVLLISGWAKKIVTGMTTKARVDVTLAKFFGNMAKWAIMVLGVLTILNTFGVDITSFAAVVAALGFAVGMALSGTLGNFAAGVMLLIFRPFKVGDVISVAGTTGKVEEIELFTTTFDTPDRRRIIVPNGSIFGSTIENISHHPTRRVDVAVGTEYAADLDKTREVLMAAARGVEGRLENEDPIVFLSELGGSSIDWSVRVFSNAADYWAVRERLTRDVKVALDNAGIGIPFPQMDVHFPGGAPKMG